MGYELFPERLKQAMKMRNVTQKELAREILITEAGLSRYINGKRIPKAPTYVKMAKFLDVDPSWLIGEDVLIKNEDSCYKCVFESREEWEMPCSRCKRKCKDYYRKGQY